MDSSKTFLKNNVFLILAIIYLILPIDLIPDRVPLFGNLDDATLFVLALIQKYVELKKEKEGEEKKEEKVQEGEIVR